MHAVSIDALLFHRTIWHHESKTFHRASENAYVALPFGQITLSSRAEKCKTSSCVYVLACMVLVNPCVLSDVPHIFRRKIVTRLPTTLPLHVSAAFIDDDDDDYWKRCCMARWTPADVVRHGGSWKRMVMERILESIIENYVPVPAECSRLHDLIPLAGSIVRRLAVRQLLPPVQVIPDGDEGDYLVLSSTNSTHFDFNQVLPQVSA